MAGQTSSIKGFLDVLIKMKVLTPALAKAMLLHAQQLAKQGETDETILKMFETDISTGDFGQYGHLFETPQSKSTPGGGVQQKGEMVKAEETALSPTQTAPTTTTGTLPTAPGTGSQVNPTTGMTLSQSMATVLGDPNNPNTGGGTTPTQGNMGGQVGGIGPNWIPQSPNYWYPGYGQQQANWAYPQGYDPFAMYGTTGQQQGDAGLGATNPYGGWVDKNQNPITRETYWSPDRPDWFPSVPEWFKMRNPGLPQQMREQMSGNSMMRQQVTQLTDDQLWELAYKGSQTGVQWYEKAAAMAMGPFSFGTDLNQPDLVKKNQDANAMRQLATEKISTTTPWGHVPWAYEYPGYGNIGEYAQAALWTGDKGKLLEALIDVHNRAGNAQSWKPTQTAFTYKGQTYGSMDEIEQAIFRGEADVGALTAFERWQAGLSSPVETNPYLSNLKMEQLTGTEQGLRDALKYLGMTDAEIDAYLGGEEGAGGGGGTGEEGGEFGQNGYGEWIDGVGWVWWTYDWTKMAWVPQIIGGDDSLERLRMEQEQKQHEDLMAWYREQQGRDIAYKQGATLAEMEANPRSWITHHKTAHQYLNPNQPGGVNPYFAEYWPQMAQGGYENPYPDMPGWMSSNLLENRIQPGTALGDVRSSNAAKLAPMSKQVWMDLPWSQQQQTLGYSDFLGTPGEDYLGGSPWAKSMEYGAPQPAKTGWFPTIQR